MITEARISRVSICTAYLADLQMTRVAAVCPCGWSSTDVDDWSPEGSERYSAVIAAGDDHDRTCQNMVRRIERVE